MYSNQRTYSIVYDAPIRELKLKMGMPIPLPGRRIRFLPEAVRAPVPLPAILLKPFREM